MKQRPCGFERARDKHDSMGTDQLSFLDSPAVPPRKREVNPLFHVTAEKGERARVQRLTLNPARGDTRRTHERTSEVTTASFLRFKRSPRSRV